MIESDVLERVLGAAMRTGGEFAEVYATDARTTSASLDDGKVEQVNSGRDRGAGIRVIKGETTGFAYTADLSERGLREAAEAAGAAASQGGGGVRTIALTRHDVRAVNDIEIFPTPSPRPPRSSCWSEPTMRRARLDQRSCKCRRVTATVASEC